MINLFKILIIILFTNLSTNCFSQTSKAIETDSKNESFKEAVKDLLTLQDV